MENQHYFHMCQKCHRIVEKVYQKGYCRECLTLHFKGFQGMLNQGHALNKKIEKKKSH